MSRVLVVDAYPRSLNVLGVSLRQAGYEVATAGDGLQALAAIESVPPDLVVTATRLPKLDGYDLVRKLREFPQTVTTPVIFVASPQDSADERSRARELGVADCLERPVFVRELVARIQLLLARHAQDVMGSPKLGGTRLRGSTRHLAVVDLVQQFEASRQNGVVRLWTDAQEARLYFRDGRIVDAELGSLHGEEAIYRAFVWYDASFEVELKPIAKEDLIGCSTQTIVRNGMHRIDEWLSPGSVETTTGSRSSSVPWTREIEPSTNDTPDDAVFAGLPRTRRTARRLVATTVALAAMIALAGGLRAMQARRLQSQDAQARSVIAAALPVGTEVAGSPAAVTEIARSVEVPAAVAPAESTPTSADAGASEPPSPPSAEPAADTTAAPSAPRETSLDVPLAGGNQSPLVGEAERALLKGDTERALSLARKAVLVDPADADSWLTLAAAEKASGNGAGAADAYRNCVELARTVGVNHCRSLGSKL